MSKKGKKGKKKIAGLMLFLGWMIFILLAVVFYFYFFSSFFFIFSFPISISSRIWI